MAVGGTDHLSGAKPTAGEQSASDCRPMIAAGILVDERRAAELAPGHHGHVLVETAFVEVLDERGQPLVELRQVRVLHAIERVAVEVPTAKVQRHHSATGLDEPPCHEKVLEVRRRAVTESLLAPLAVAVTDPLRLLRDVDRLGEPAAGEDVEGGLRERVHAGERPTGVDVTAEDVEPPQEVAAVVESARGDVLEHHVAAGRSIGPECRVRHAEEAGQPRRAVGWVARVGREPHERRHRPVHRPEHLRGHRSDARPSARRLVTDRAAGVADERIMIAVRRAVHTPQHDALVHDPRHPRHVLADLQARDVRADRPELAADLRRRVHLHVVHVLMRRRAAHVDHDHGLVR